MHNKRKGRNCKHCKHCKHCKKCKNCKACKIFTHYKLGRLAVCFCVLLLFVLSPYQGVAPALTAAAKPANIVVFQDDFTNHMQGQKDAKQYYNLKIAPYSMGVWEQGRFPAFLTSRNRRTPGGVIYRVQNASHISVSVLTYMGSMVARNDDGSYRLGRQQQDPPFPSVMGQGLYSPSRDAVYMTRGEQAYINKYDADNGLLAFEKTESLPGDVIPYGVHVSTSSDGSNYLPLTLVYSGGEAVSGHSMVVEHFSASIPSNARFIKVETTTRVQLPDVDGSQWEMSVELDTLLAAVKIQGVGLQLGIPEESQTESEITTPPESSTSPPNDKEEGGKTSSPKNVAGKKKTESNFQGGAIKGEKETREEVAPSTGGKFQGEIPLPNSSAASKGGAQGGTGKKNSRAYASAPTGKEPSTVVPEQEDALPQQGEDSQVLYQIPAEDKKQDSFRTGVTVYIVLATGLIFFLLLRPPRKK